MGGNVHARMDHGDLSAHEIAGDVTVDGHSGDITLSDVKGNVTLDGEFFGDTISNRLAPQYISTLAARTLRFRNCRVT